MRQKDMELAMVRQAKHVFGYGRTRGKRVRRALHSETCDRRARNVSGQDSKSACNTFKVTGNRKGQYSGTFIVRELVVMVTFWYF